MATIRPEGGVAEQTWSTADLLQAAEQVLAGLGSQGLSAEVAFESRDQIAPFINAIELARERSAKTEGRPAGTSGLMVIDGRDLAACRRDVKAEMALYDDIVHFEYDGTPPTSKLFVVDAGSKRHLHVSPDFQPVKRLTRALNDSERARFLLLTRHDSKGLRLFRRSIVLNFAVDGDNELVHVDRSHDELPDMRQKRQQEVSQRYDEFIENRLTNGWRLTKLLGLDFVEFF